MEQKTTSISSYYPVAVLILGSYFMSIAVTSFSLSLFMGVLLCQFALLKLYSIRAFASAYKMYDIVAMRLPQWGYVYPFVEFFLGIAFITGLYPFWAPVVTIALMGIGAVGVALSIVKGVDLKCACMGGILDVPLGYVSIGEDLAMLVMAIAMLLAL